MRDVNQSLEEAERFSLARHLKIVTRTAHDDVEAAFNLAAAVADVTSYIDTLQRFHSVHGCILRAAQNSTARNAGPLLANLELRLNWLDRDLRHFAARPARIAAPPFALTDAFDVLGCEYVVRGSALGGAVIYKRLRAVLGISADAGASFFAGDGKDAGAAFDEFKTRLEAAGKDERATAKIACAAGATFHLFRSVLSVAGGVDS